jgi:hypothetical protein
VWVVQRAVFHLLEEPVPTLKGVAVFNRRWRIWGCCTGEQHADVPRAAADVQDPHARGDPGQAERVRAVRGQHPGLKLQALGLIGGAAHHITTGHVITLILSIAVSRP